jgi:hypothetical protein
LNLYFFTTQSQNGASKKRTYLVRDKISKNYYNAIDPQVDEFAYGAHAKNWEYLLLDKNETYFGLYNKTTESVVIEPIYEHFKVYEHFITAGNKNAFGVLGFNSDTLFPFCGDNLSTLIHGKYLVMTKKLRYAVINENFDLITPFSALGINAVALEQSPYLIIRQVSGYGLFNPVALKYVLEPVYSDLYSSNGKGYIAIKDKKYYYFNNALEQISDATYDRILNMNNYFLVSSNGIQGLTDKTFQVKIPTQYTKISEGKNGQFLASGKNGIDVYDKNFVITRTLPDIVHHRVQYRDRMWSNDNNEVVTIFPVQNIHSKKRGCLSLDGSYILKPQYDSISYHSAHLIYSANGKFNFIENLPYQIKSADSCIYDEVVFPAWTDDIMLVNFKGKYGLRNVANTSYLLEAVYDTVSSLSNCSSPNTLVKAVIGKKMFLYNPQTQQLQETKCDDILSYDNERAILKIADKWALYDFKTNKYILSPSKNAIIEGKKSGEYFVKNSLKNKYALFHIK